MTVEETVEDTPYLCTYVIGGVIDPPHPCGKPAAAVCHFGTEEQRQYGTVWYCLRHFRVAYDFIARDGNDISGVGLYDGQAASALLD